MILTPRILREARLQATLQANRIRTAYQRSQIKSWEDLEKMFKICVPDSHKAKPFVWGNIGAGTASFCNYWELSFEARLTAETTKEVATKVTINKDVDTFGSITLFPEQQGVFKAIESAFFDKDESAILQDGHTGVGKTIVAAALIAEMRKKGFFSRPDVAIRLHPVMIFCPNGVEENWKRELEKAGLGDMLKNRKILVFPDGFFSSEHSRMFVDEHEDVITEEVTITWNPVLVPYLCIVDEYHRYANKDTWRTKALFSLVKTKAKKHFLTMSATPMEKVNDAWLFTMMANKVFMGTFVNEDTFKQFAQLVDPRPDKPNREALKRLRSILSNNIISFPYVKPKHKAINTVWLVDFIRPEHKAIYDSAQQRYIEACAKSGKNTMWGRFEVFIALNNFRKTAEPLRAGHLSERTANNYHSGNRATAIFTAYKETITEVAFQLVDKYRIPREQISIIWGGKKEYKPVDLLSKEEIDNILKNPNIGELIKNKALLRKIRLTLRYMQDQHEHSESIEEQSYRHNRLKELRLVGNQSQNARQIEIDKYQSGDSKIVLATIASGGIGLSFDRNKPSLLRREGIFTPIYSGKEFQQALGRLVRRASIDDADQLICMLRDTVEEYHVAPILDEKLKCIAEITNRSFDIIDLLTRTDKPMNRITVRDQMQASIDAEKDDTIVADFVKENEEDDDEEEGEII